MYPLELGISAAHCDGNVLALPAVSRDPVMSFNEILTRLGTNRYLGPVVIPS